VLPAKSQEKISPDQGSGLRICDSQSTAKLFAERHGRVGREFKLWPFSNGSILTFLNKIEPLKSERHGRHNQQNSRRQLTAPGKLAINNTWGWPYHPRAVCASNIFEVDVAHERCVCVQYS
jgi:hypothetical protein